nr:reverse transcriptase [Tanacetum cinerariifolium]
MSICFVYTPHDRFWDSINKRSSSNGPRLAIRDLNLIGELGDKQGGSSRSLQHIEEFQQFVAVAGLIDIPFSRLKYTWSNKRCDGDNIQERIDRALCNIELFEACPFHTLFHKPFIGSDHAPLIYSTHAPQTKKRPCICFESMWTTHNQCESTIRKAWATNSKDDTLAVCMCKIVSVCLSSYKMEQ